MKTFNEFTTDIKVNQNNLDEAIDNYSQINKNLVNMIQKLSDVNKMLNGVTRKAIVKWDGGYNKSLGQISDNVAKAVSELEDIQKDFYNSNFNESKEK